MTKGKILIVDDEKDIRFLLGEILSDEGYTIAEAPHSEAAFAEINAHGMPDLVILDIWLENSDRDGMEILADLKKKSRTLPVLMISGHGNIEMAVKAIKLGAYDFIEKPFNTDRLLNLVRRALESGSLRRNVPGGGAHLVTLSPEMQAVQKTALKSAAGDARVLITGPWGSGRTHLARWMHQESPRSAKPFIALPCRDMDVNVLNDALTRAGEGTLVFQDVHLVPADMQAMVLARLNAKLDARIMATSLPGAKILPDLYERLSVTSIVLPPLEERRGDMGELCLSILGEGYTVSDEALGTLRHRAWPGHVAELRALMAMAAVRMTLEGTHDLRPHHIAAGDAAAPAPQASTPADWLATDLRTARESFERWYFEHLMERFDGNVSQVASFAGMDRTALHRKLKSLKEGAADGERLAS